MTDLFEFDLGDAAEPNRDITQFMTAGDSYVPSKLKRSVSPKAPKEPSQNVISAHSNTPPFKKSKWTPEEDQFLMESVNKHGMGNWSLVCQTVPGRSGKQCRERWINQLCPALNKDNWTPQEDAILIQQQRIHGNFWTKIAQFLPGRSANNVKNRWGWLSRHRILPNLSSQNMQMLMLSQQENNQSNQIQQSPQSPVINPPDHNPTLHPSSQIYRKPPMPMIHYPIQNQNLTQQPEFNLSFPAELTPPVIQKSAFSDPFDVNLSLPNSSFDVNNQNFSSEHDVLKLSFDEADTMNFNNEFAFPKSFDEWCFF